MLEKKKIILLMLFVVTIATSFIIIKILTEKADNSNDEIKKGELSMNENTFEEFINTPTDDIVAADNDYYEKRKYHVAIIDPDDILSKINFLPTKAHFVKNEEIAKYLHQVGYDCDEVEVTSDIPPFKKDNNSTFYCQLPEYDNVLLKCTWYGMTEEFKFEIVPK